jgi:spore maturation protein CgeB
MRADRSLDIVMFGLSITSSWGNGHATTYRALVRALRDRGHRIRFFERDRPWYASHRDLSEPKYCTVHLYQEIADLQRFFRDEIRADLVVLGSFVPEGGRVADWMLPRASGVTAFYDIDTPVTVSKLADGKCDYLRADLVSRFDLYLSFSAGPILNRLRSQFGAQRPRAFHCSVEPRDYSPTRGVIPEYDLAYLGTYSADRQAGLERLLMEPAREWKGGRFCVTGPQYPRSIVWPANVTHVEHLAPGEHRHFYNAQRVTLNLTRADMMSNGYSPSVRLFEAAACGTPIITDDWDGLEDFFQPGREVLVVRTARDVLNCLRDIDADTLRRIGSRARMRVLGKHTSAHRALELEAHVDEVVSGAPAGARAQTDSISPVCAS